MCQLLFTSMSTFVYICLKMTEKVTILCKKSDFIFACVINAQSKRKIRYPRDEPYSLLDLPQPTARRQLRRKASTPYRQSCL